MQKWLLTSYQLQKSPETQDDEQPSKFALFTSQDDLEHERRHDNGGIEEVER
jgi:hypothetical protein